VFESHFGESAPFSVGIEEELMILDAETLQPVAAVDRFVGTPGFKTELHASVVELNTGVCADAASAVEELRALRSVAFEIAASNGLTIAAGGSHPTAPFDSLPVVQEERYLAMVRDVGWAARRQGVNGLHVHVGVSSGDACWERLEAVLPWLPVVLAVSANSPFLEGVATGMLSSRASILAELPRSGAPTVFDGYADWEAWVERLIALGLMDDYTRIWWDVRPHPRFGTLEVRVADQPTSIERTALIAGLVVSLVASAPSASAQRGDYLQNRWAAAHLGLDAQLIHPDGDRLASARELAAELLGVEPPEPEALLQLRAGVDGAAADLVTRTLG
jgi:glutamate---cysteine ligase / carboxylate-amine ligase